MKPERNKIVFIGMMLCIIAFIVLYALSLGGESEDSNGDPMRPVLPELGEGSVEFTTKIEAVDAIKEQRETPKPSLYGAQHIDSLGRYDPDLEIRERQRIVDSIYRLGRIDYGKGEYREVARETALLPETKPETTSLKDPEPVDLEKAHRGFFGSRGVVKEETGELQPVLAVVHGQQTLRAGERLELRLLEELELEGRSFGRNSLLHGFVSFKANRVLVRVHLFGESPISLKAFDRTDGLEGIYVEHSYRQEAEREVLDDAVQDLNISGLPQLGGIKQVFRRSNRRVRVTVMDQYQLMLKP